MAQGTEDVLTLISCSGDLVSVDRLLFLRKSAYYKALAMSGMKDSESKILKFDVLSKASLEEVYNFFVHISKDEVSNLMKAVNVEAGLEAASYLQIDEMVDKYCTFLLAGLNHNTWFYILDLCQKYGLSRCRDVALRFVCEHFGQCSTEEDFLYLSSDQIKFVLQSDETYADSEVDIFTATQKWLMHDSSRFDLIPELLKYIRFELMNDYELQESKTLLNSMNVEPVVINSIFNISTHGIHPRMRCAVKTMVALGGFTRKEFSTNRFQVLPTSELRKILEINEQVPSISKSGSLATINFKSRKSYRLPRTLCEHGACVLNGNLYIAGGQVQYHDSGRQTTNEVFVFNPTQQEWSSCTSMNFPRSLFYLGELNGFLYAVSGCTASNMDTETVERYLPEENRWEMVTSLEVRVHELAGCRYKGSIYVSGGFRGPTRGHVDLVWKYEPVFNRWTKKASMLTPRSYHAMVEVCDKLFVMGGVCYLGDDRFQDILDGEMYDTTLDQWSRVLQLYHPASCMSSVVVDDDVLLFGGHSFVRNKEHDFVQVVSVSKAVSNRVERDYGNSIKKLKPCHRDVAFDCRIFNFEARGIFYFGLCEMDLPRKLVEKFH